MSESEQGKVLWLFAYIASTLALASVLMLVFPESIIPAECVTEYCGQATHGPFGLFTVPMSAISVLAVLGVVSKFNKGQENHD